MTKHVPECATSRLSISSHLLICTPTTVPWPQFRLQGWGSVWYEEKVEAGEVSDPYLMTGFDKKVLHLSCDGCANNTDKTDKIEVRVCTLNH